uniref:SPFH domain-containing protein n=1 Tax=Capnocytophaga leadbetteri TaxID=327575 RepID=UPI0028D0C06B|nr:SPFH domain-containing protein [Capnocytophaga leadbetteri]
MAIIDLVSWSPQGNRTIYAWRFPETNLSTYTQIVVQESQEAVLFSKGQIIGKFGPGKHTLNTENLPILRNLFGIPFGGKNPFTAEVWFVNKVQNFSIDWAVSKMIIQDPDYNTQLPLVAGGRYGLKVDDAEKFLIKAVGTKSEFAQEDLTDQFFGEFSTKTKSQIAQYVLKHRVGYKYLSAYLDELSEYLKNVLNPFWEQLGLQLLKFNITTIDIDTSTEEGKKVATAIATQASMSITGHTWQQEQMFNTANKAVEGFGNGSGGLLGGLMAMSMMGGLGGGNAMGSSMMQPQYQQPTFGGNSKTPQSTETTSQPMKMVYCSNCAKKYPSSSRFCPHCGDPYNPCPKCGADNDPNAKRCVSCGTSLQQPATLCPHCSAPLEVGATFCGNCGKQVQALTDTCSRCGTELPPSVKFCPKCGKKRDS